MTTQTNQEIINSFFEGYGPDTAKEYGQTFFDLITLLQEKQVATQAFSDDLTGKLSSLYRLISSIAPEVKQPSFSDN